MSAAIENLLAILDLEPLEVNLFRGLSPQVGWQRVFGGQVLGQALVAAIRTVEEPDRLPHSMHAYFLLAGDPKVPIIYDVERVRDGKSFTTRRVKAIQHGQPIFVTSVSFHRHEPGHGAPGQDARRADARGAAERGRDQGARAAADARPGAALLRARAADRAAAGRVRRAISARSTTTGGSTCGSAPPASCPIRRQSTNACWLMRPT